MENLGRLNRAVNKKVLDKEKVREIIEDIVEVFAMLQTEFDLSMPLKIHIIISHYLEFFNEKNESMLSYNDEFTESMHSAIRLQIVWHTRGSKSTWGAWVDGYSLDCYDY